MIRDTELGTEILLFDQTNEAISQLREDLQIDRLTLALKYPDLIKFGLPRFIDSKCEFWAMADNQAFLNDFGDNRARFGAYTDQVQRKQRDQLLVFYDLLSGQIDRPIVEN